MRQRAAAVLALALLIAWVAPLVGLAAAGQDLWPYLRFPPRTEKLAHASFSWSVFLLLSLPAATALVLFLIAMRQRTGTSRPSFRFPSWGGAGLVLIAAGWFAAWHDVLPLEWRRQAFTPLWFGYIVLMNALAHRRAGQSLLTHRTGWFLALFPASAAFWWLFEHLNQFVDNWHYSGIEARGDWNYFLQGSLPFSTVLPAVASTWFWLRQFPRLELLRLPSLSASAPFAWAALLAGALGLAAIGLWPQALFSMLWLGPLLLLLGLQKLLLGETLLAPLARGDWRPLLQPALAALLCGLLWEFWNWGSLARWHYSVPYVQRFHLFEMPLLGYVGYLPFGVTCALAADTLARLVERRGLY